MKKALLMAVALIAAVTAEAKFSRKAVIDGYTPVGMTLQGNTVYEVLDNVTLTASGPGACALNVNPNTMTALMIPKGITLTLNGGNADARSGAGPALRLPGNSTLVIMGEGTLKATGGRSGYSTGASSGGVRNVPADAPQPRITSIEIANGQVVLKAKDTIRCLKYGAEQVEVQGKDPGTDLG